MPQKSFSGNGPRLGIKSSHKRAHKAQEAQKKICLHPHESFLCFMCLFVLILFCGLKQENPVITDWVRGSGGSTEGRSEG
jgi:hypothetical protein